MKAKTRFNQNLDRAIIELTGCTIEEIELYKFLLIPIAEKKGTESSRDDWMINVVSKNNQIENIKSYFETIRLLSGGRSSYPLWAKIKIEEEYVIRIEFSMRYRHIKTCLNQERGYPPFEVLKG